MHNFCEFHPSGTCSSREMVKTHTEGKILLSKFGACTEELANKIGKLSCRSPKVKSKMPQYLDLFCVLNLSQSEQLSCYAAPLFKVHNLCQQYSLLRWGKINGGRAPTSGAKSLISIDNSHPVPHSAPGGWDGEHH